MNELELNLKHPKVLYLLFFTEMWERFSYYGMRALLILYIVSNEGGLGWSKQDAGQLYGIYTGLVYVTPLIGGYLADRYFGSQFSVILGGLLMALGHLALAFEPLPTFYLGLVLLIIGNGFFKPNISSMVGKLYPEGTPKAQLKDSAYTIFYMGINLGAFLGSLICGFLGEKMGWHYGFGAAGIGMSLGLITFIAFRYLLGDIGHKPSASQKTERAELLLTSVDKDRISVIFVLSFFSIFFWVAFEQAGSSLNIFTYEYINRETPWGVIPASVFQSVNALLIIILAPLMAEIWKKLSSHQKDISNPLKFSLALFLLALGFVMLVVGSKLQSKGEISVLWLIGAYFWHTIGELCLSPIGLSAVSKLSPTKFVSIMMGIWFMASALANYIGGAISGYMEEVAKHSEISNFFLIFVYSSMIAGGVMFFISKKLTKLMH